MNIWIIPAKPQTLLVSLSSVVIGSAIGFSKGHFHWPVLLICAILIVLAHLAFNFSIEYYNYKYQAGKRCVVRLHSSPHNGIISASKMCRMVYCLMAVVCLLGASLCFWGGWKILVVGLVCIVCGYLYNGGPFPLSRHGLGQVFFFFFFGFIPVTMTAYLHGVPLCYDTITAGIALGLMDMNLLIVYDCRDMLEDKLSGKHTPVIIFGKRKMSIVYLLSGIFAIAILYNYWLNTLMLHVTLFAPIAYLVTHFVTWNKIALRNDDELNPVLRQTIINQLIFVGLFTILLFMLTKRGL